MNDIFGYSFSDILRAQQGGRLGRVIDVSRPQEIDSDRLKKDIALLAEFGESGLREKGFTGTLDRLEREGLLEKGVGKPFGT